MASALFNSSLFDMARGLIDYDTDVFKCLLTTGAYVENKKTHTKRSDVTNEIAATGGYTAGGVGVTVTVTLDSVNDRIDIALGGFTIPNATITAGKAVYYKSRGGVATADEIVAVVDFAGNVVSTSGAWSLSASTQRLSNP